MSVRMTGRGNANYGKSARKKIRLEAFREPSRILKLKRAREVELKARANLKGVLIEGTLFHPNSVCDEIMIDNKGNVWLIELKSKRDRMTETQIRAALLTSHYKLYRFNENGEIV